MANARSRPPRRPLGPRARGRRGSAPDRGARRWTRARPGGPGRPPPAARPPSRRPLDPGARGTRAPPVERRGSRQQRARTARTRRSTIAGRTRRGHSPHEPIAHRRGPAHPSSVPHGRPVAHVWPRAALRSAVRTARALDPPPKGRRRRRGSGPTRRSEPGGGDAGGARPGALACRPNAGRDPGSCRAPRRVEGGLEVAASTGPRGVVDRPALPKAQRTTRIDRCEASPAHREAARAPCTPGCRLRSRCPADHRRPAHPAKRMPARSRRCAPGDRRRPGCCRASRRRARHRRRGLPRFRGPRQRTARRSRCPRARAGWRDRSVDRDHRHTRARARSGPCARTRRRARARWDEPDARGPALRDARDGEPLEHPRAAWSA